MNFLRSVSLLGAALGALSLSTAFAQGTGAFPQRPVKIVVPVAAGGGSDLMARHIAERLGPLLGQSVIVENRVGANSVLAAQYALSQPADGHTVMMTNSVMALRTTLPNSPYDLRKDFDPLIQVGNGTYILYVNANLPVKNVKELIAYAKGNPGKMNFSSIGVGTAVHLCVELLAMRGGFSMTHIPYSGSTTSIAAVMSGDVQASVDALAVLRGQIDAGKVRALAVTSAKRWDLAPEWPGMEEAGVPNFDVTFWIAFAVKAGTPAAVNSKLGADIGRVLQDQGVKDYIRKLGTSVTGTPAAELAKITAREVQTWSDVIKSANIKLE
jgi:tripartite-type tricarboxylate transporter receptor subunit TctC